MATTDHDSEISDGIEAETTFDVSLYIYDMSKGLAKMFSQMLIGKQIPGIWHTGVVAYGREYFFGSGGVESCEPGGTVLGEPDQIMHLGQSQLPYSLFLEYIFGLGESGYAPGTYELFRHNCNNFSNEVSTFLTGKPIPQEIIDLPTEFLTTPLGQTVQQYFQSMNLRAEGSRGLAFGASADIANYQPREIHNRESANHNNGVTNNNNMSAQAQENRTEEPVANGAQAEAVPVTKAAAPAKKESAPIIENNEPTTNGATAVNGSAELEATNGQSAENTGRTGRRRSSAASNGDQGEETSTYVSRRQKKYPDPPFVFTEVDGVECSKKLLDMLESKFNPEEMQALKEFHEYLMTDNGAWALGANHLSVIGKTLTDPLPPEVPVLMLKMLEAAALKDDVILILHQDRQGHNIMSHLYKIERVPLEQQIEITKLVCNMCNHPGTFDWLMYISEWDDGGHSCSNSKVTVRVAVHSLLAENHDLQEKGVSLMFNLALKELFDDSATELATALLQYLHGDLSEEKAFCCLTALLRFMYISYNDVPALIQMLGPDISKFCGKSSRVDEVIEQIRFKLSVTISA